LLLSIRNFTSSTIKFIYNLLKKLAMVSYTTLLRLTKLIGAELKVKRKLVPVSLHGIERRKMDGGFLASIKFANFQ